MTDIRHIPPEVLAVGPVTTDVIDGDRRPGGAVSYAARAATAMGVRLAILTVAAPDAALGPLEGHDLHSLPAQATLTFQHSSSPDGRRLRVLARPGRTLSATDLPPAWRPRLVILMPLLPDDIDLQSFANLDAPDGRALLAQGLQRTVDASSTVTHRSHPSPALLSATDETTTVFLSQEEVSSWTAADLQRVAGSSARLVITCGEAGADIRRGDARLHIDATPAAACDTTGAGDVFATAFMLALASGLDDAAAGTIASRLAARAVEQPGPQPLSAPRPSRPAGPPTQRTTQRAAPP